MRKNGTGVGKNLQGNHPLAMVWRYQRDQGVYSSAADGKPQRHTVAGHYDRAGAKGYQYGHSGKRAGHDRKKNPNGAVKTGKKRNCVNKNY